MSGEVKPLFVVETENVARIYRIGEETVKAVDGITLRVREGELRALMGPSGSGKTTLLNLIGGLDKPTSGRVFLAGREVSGMDQVHISLLRKLAVGFIFQVYNLLPVLSAIENVELPMEFANISKKDRELKAKELLRIVGLSHRLNHRPSELSGGEQQRATVARALANEPYVLLADEPTGNLDTKTGLELISLMKNFAHKLKVTILVATHDPKVADAADSITYLRDGKIVSEEVKMAGISTGSHVVLEPVFPISSQIASLLEAHAYKELLACEMKSGDSVSVLGTSFKVKETHPDGQIRVVHQTKVTIQS